MNEKQKKIMVPYEEKTDTCPDCSNIPCDCGLPAGYTPTPWTDANEEDGWNPCGWAVDSNLVRELERELAAVTEQRDRLAEACKLLMASVGELKSSLDYCWVSEDEMDAAWNISNEALAAVKGGADES